MLSSVYLYTFDWEYFCCFDIIIMMLFYIVYDDWLELQMCYLSVSSVLFSSLLTPIICTEILMFTSSTTCQCHSENVAKIEYKSDNSQVLRR